MVGGRLVVWRLLEIEAINDKEGKPVGIDRRIDKRPIFVAGNVGNYGDIAMMQYSKRQDNGAPNWREMEHRKGVDHRFGRRTERCETEK